ncbi:MAG: TA system antitoxin ParD family protein [Cyanobium sp.]
MRLQEELMRSAALAGSLHQRSAAQQVEYWAALGREVAEWLDPERLLEVKTGLARLKLEPVRAAAVDPERVFAAVEEARGNGSLAASVSSAAVRYQASSRHPGYLERINSDGSRSIGSFSGGVFHPCDPGTP